MKRYFMKKPITASSRIDIDDNIFTNLSAFEKKIVAKANNSTDPKVYLTGAAEALELAGVEVTEAFENLFSGVVEHWFDKKEDNSFWSTDVSTEAEIQAEIQKALDAGTTFEDIDDYLNELYNMNIIDDEQFSTLINWANKFVQPI